MISRDNREVAMKDNYFISREFLRKLLKEYEQSLQELELELERVKYDRPLFNHT